MKKILALSALVCCVPLFLALAGCSMLGGNKDNEKSYSQLMNEKLVSFTDCANAFSESLERIAGSKSAPSDSQIEDIQNKLDRLQAACIELSGQKAPAEYSAAQKAIDTAMADYSDAADNCSALLEFYGAYDDLFRKFNNPAEGSVEMEKKERALYDRFAKAMMKATDSFRAACEEFDKVQLNNNSGE